MRAGDTALIDAARHGRAADVAALLADGADVNEPKTSGDGVTALWVAACYLCVSADVKLTTSTLLCAGPPFST